MTETFTASNGGTVELRGSGRLAITDHNPEQVSEHVRTISRTSYLDPTQADAIREFFLHERDKELGRWRWPENPDLVVYQRTPEIAAVLHEPSGQILPVRAGEYPGEETGFSGAANAYFAAHPEPKPWHDAQVGEVWVVKIQTGPAIDEIACIVVEKGDALMFEDPVDEVYIRVTGEILDARRIWPEVVSDA